MPRLPRPDIACIPQHVVQRGNNRLPCFLEDDDRLTYLACLRETSLRYRCSLHAYVLMSNHVHLLVTPEHVGCVARMMQNLGRAYVQIFNARHRRTGTLWEGRYKSCLVDSESYVLRCYRYIELNPVRAWMVEHPGQHPWSSFAGNVGLRPDPLLTPHPVYTALGDTLIERGNAYRALLAETLSEDDLAEIRLYLQQQRALGSSDFQRRVEQTLKRFAAARPPHRPRRTHKALE